MYDSKKQTVIIILSIALAFLCIYGVKHIKTNYFSDEKSTTQKVTPKPTKPIDTTEETTTEEITTTEPETVPYENINLTFAGNIKLKEELMESIASGSVFTQGLSSKIEKSDFSMFNLQTAIAAEADLAFGNTSSNYTQIENKLYIKQLGFSGAALANNYIMECGPNTITPTMLALESVGMYHAGAGNNLEEAMKPIISEINGKKICIISTTRSFPNDDWIASNKNIFDDKDTCGVFSSKDTNDITELILKQKEVCDFIIVYMNCGNEGTEDLDAYQQYLAHILVDAGANLIIGCSPDMVQGIEYYKNTPIVYSLGTFLNAETEGTSALLSVTIKEDNSANCSILPCSLKESSVSFIDDESKLDFYEQINELSNEMNAQISEDGTISEIPQ